MKWSMVIVAACLSLAGCRDSASSGPTDAAVASEDAKPARLDGLVLVDDRMVKVGPFIVHRPQMDLRTSCRVKRDEDQKRGVVDPPLCFDPAKRSRNAITSIRVEDAAGKKMKDVLAALRRADEAVHFIVDRTGTIYQMLDTIWSARRAGMYRKGEIRVIALDSAGKAKLIPALQSVFGPRPLTVAEHEFAAAKPAPSSPPDPPTDAEPTKKEVEAP